MIINDAYLKRLAKWGLNSYYSSSGCNDDEDFKTIEDKIECVVGDFKEFLAEDYPKGFANMPQNPTIYRLIKLEKFDDFKKNTPGIFWFADKNHPKNNPGFFDMLEHLKETNIYLITGQTHISNIDIGISLWERSTQWIENEIRVIDDKKIKILSINKY